MSPDFSAFFEDVWGYAPFPWQARLAAQVAATGWPEVLDVPTGAGKTAVLDIALWHLALDGGHRAPRRIVLVVDRRVIVDQVGVRARALHAALLDKDKPAASQVGARLKAMVGDGAPLLETTVLRGASLRDDAWAHYPHVPVLAASTVDQVGSRLFFRGYGVSASMRPVHAGLLGCDTLLLLDEVHLARPFADVLQQLSRIRGAAGEVPRRFHMVQLSATPGSSVGDVFRIDEADRANARLAPRLNASKPAVLVAVGIKVRDDESVKRQAMADAAAHHARELVKSGKRAVAVVVNRVDTARRVWSSLGGSVGDASFDVALITGRMRPLDQQAVLAGILPRVDPDRGDADATRPLVIVATQCIEAGADFDFDGLVTECASLDALRQRFGRVDRRGGRPSRSVVLGRSDVAKGPDPVYGGALAATWEWLSEIADGGSVDFGIDALEPHLDALADGVDRLKAPNRAAPVLMPAFLDQWAQTNPVPHADPEVGLFLHGIPEDARSALPDVQVVWRADITEEDLRLAKTAGANGVARLVEQLNATPPGALEALGLPIWTAKSWLDAGRSDGLDDAIDIADVDGQLAPEPTPSWHRSQARGTLVLLWRGQRDTKVVRAKDVPPGAMIIVPATRGGLGPHLSFDPEPCDGDGSPVAVSDLGDAVQLLQRGRPSLRLAPAVLGPFVGTAFAELLPEPADEAAEERAAVRECFEAVLASVPEDAPAWIHGIKRAFGAEKTRPRLVKVEGGDGLPRWVVVGRVVTPKLLRAFVSGEAERADGLEVLGDATTAGEDGSFIGRRATLTAHLDGVAGLADRFGRGAGLPTGLVATLRWAGQIHDVGKVDQRFQLWLYEGDEVAQSVGEVLAKSGLARPDAAARRRARERAGYARGQRHELVSLDMAEGSVALRARVEGDGADWDLLLHLVASHHGWCRPVAPAMSLDETDAEDVRWEVSGLCLAGTTAHGRGRMDSGVVDRFWRLVRRYGWHELAYLEAVLRLADHRRSALEEAAQSDA